MTTIRHLHHHGHHTQGHHHTRRTFIDHLRRIRNGDVPTILNEWRGRWVSQDATTPGGASGFDESVRNILVENELGPIIDVRIDEVPKAFQYEPMDKTDSAQQEIADALNEWAATVSRVEGQDLFTAFADIVCDQEEDGNAAVVMGTNEAGEVWFVVRDTMDLQEPTRDPQTGEIVKLDFRWTRFETVDGQEEPVEIEFSETFTKDMREFKRAGEVIEEKSGPLPGFIPVVLIPRIRAKGRSLATSGIEGLVEPLLNYLWSLYLLNMANKYEAHGVYCPVPSDDDGAFAGDQDGGRLTQLRLLPGSLVPVPIQKVGGSINTDTIQAQVQGRLESMRRAGFVKEKGEDDADARSGKAMLIGNARMKGYIKRKLRFLKAGLRRIATLWWWFTNKDTIGQDAPVFADFGTVEDDDAQEQTKRSELGLKAKVAGEITSEQFYGIWVREGMFDEDADPTALAEALEEEQDAEEETQMGRMVEAMRQGVGEEGNQGPTAAGSSSNGTNADTPQPPPANGGGEPVIPRG